MASQQNSSCNPGAPFIKLGDGSGAPILSYNIPQETCYDVNLYFPVLIPDGHFKQETKNPPQQHTWASLTGKTIQSIVEGLKEDILTGRTQYI